MVQACCGSEDMCTSRDNAPRNANPAWLRHRVWLCRSGMGEPKDLQAQALAEAVDNAEKESGGHKTDQDDAQAVVLDEQEVDAEGQGAEVEEAEDAQNEARDGLPPPGAPLLPRAVAGQCAQARGTVQPHHLQPAQALWWGYVLWHLQDGDDQAVGAGCGLQHAGAKEYLRR